MGMPSIRSVLVSLGLVKKTNMDVLKMKTLMK